MAEPLAKYLDAVCYVAGELRPVESLTCLDDSTRKTLAAAGLQTTSVYEGTLSGLVQELLRRILEKSERSPSEIDAVVLSTATYWQGKEAYPEYLGRALLANGLGHCKFVMSSVLACVNTANALRCARDLIDSREARNVIVLTADIAPPDDRTVYGNTSVLGDGGAGGVLSANRASGYELLQVFRHDEHSLSPTVLAGDEISVMKKVQVVLDGLRLAAKKADAMAAECGEGELAACDVFIANNYTKFIHTYTMNLLGLKGRRTYIENIPRTGHVFSSDNLINLADMAEAGRIYPGDRILMLGTGTHSYGFTTLRRTGT